MAVRYKDYVRKLEGDLKKGKNIDEAHKEAAKKAKAKRAKKAKKKKERSILKRVKKRLRKIFPK